MSIPQFTGQVPSRDDPANFSERAEALFDWMVNEMVPGANNLEGSLTLVGSTGTSTTSMTVGTGARSLTTQPSKNWIAGAYVYVVSASAVGNAMLGQVTAYNPETGALSINVVSTTGSGTHSAWIIGLSLPMFPIQAAQLASGAVVGSLGYTPANADVVSLSLSGKAALAGSAAQTFAVGAATNNEHAVRLDQVGVANAPLTKTALNASGSPPIYACRAWVNFQGTGTVTIRASGNVASITDIGPGFYDVIFTTPMPDENYATILGSGNNAAGTQGNQQAIYHRAPSTTFVAILTADDTGQSSAEDCPWIDVAIFR